MRILLNEEEVKSIISSYFNVKNKEIEIVQEDGIGIAILVNVNDVFIFKAVKLAKMD